MNNEPVHSKLTTPFDEPRATVSVRPTVGSKTSFKGDLTAEEDLIIEGRVEGKVDLKANCVTIGHSGSVKGNVYAKVINVEGELFGDAFAGEKVNVYKSGNVKGNITAPRVSLEDGAKLKGVIDMEPAIMAAAQAIPAAVASAEKNVDKAQESVASLAKGASAPKKTNEAATSTTATSGETWRS